MTRDQRNGEKHLAPLPEYGRRKGRHSKKDKAKTKQERIKQW